MSAKILAVVHARYRQETRDNVQLALDCGCDGVFLISHGEISNRVLLGLAAELNPQQTGINFLGTKVSDAFKMVGTETSMLWSDYTPVGKEREDIVNNPSDYCFAGKFFGGVAFKYQPQPDDLRKAAEDVKGFVDVLTTSGVATGSAPDIEKLAILAEGFGKKIGVASGVTSDNVVPMLPYVDHFLVATGIGKDFHNIDEEKCRKLVETIRSAE